MQHPAASQIVGLPDPGRVRRSVWRGTLFLNPHIPWYRKSNPVNTIGQIGNALSAKKPTAPPVAPSGSDSITTKEKFERDYQEMCRQAVEPFNRKLFEEAWQVMRQTGQGY